MEQAEQLHVAVMEKLGIHYYCFCSFSPAHLCEIEAVLVIIFFVP